MNKSRIILLSAVVCVGAGAWVVKHAARPKPLAGTPETKQPTSAEGSNPVVVPPVVVDANPQSVVPADAPVPEVAQPVAVEMKPAAGGVRAPKPQNVPVRSGAKSVDTAAHPAVPVARLALSFVGADDGAEAVWADAINDPSVPAEARKDLIEDLNEDGFPDPKNVGPEDLPLIVSRLDLIERMAPEAMDDVNADAFAEAYKDLLNMMGKIVQ